MLTTERVVTERRQAPRMTVKELAYVNLDRDNGGIILDVSEGGLCFQATAPVQCVEKVRLWFSYRSPRTQAKPEHALKQDGQTNSRLDTSAIARERQREIHGLVSFDV